MHTYTMYSLSLFPVYTVAGTNQQHNHNYNEESESAVWPQVLTTSGGESVQVQFLHLNI